MSPPGRPILLAYRALGLGDLLCAVPALRALRRAFPRHRLLLATPAPLHGLARCTGSVDGVLPASPLGPLPPFLQPPDLAVNLHGRGPQSHRVVLATAPHALVAFRHPDIAETSGAPAWRADEHEVDRWCRLLTASAIPADPRDLRIPAPDLAMPSWARGATLIHPGAASPARRWPAERWSRVALAERAAGREVIVTGSSAELSLASAVAEGAGLGPESVLAGTTDLVQLAALVAAAGRVVCGDTGVAHLATALGTPSVILFGPTSPSHWGPRIDPHLHVVLWAGRAGDPHGRRPDPGLLEISIEDVIEALASLDRACGDPDAPRTVLAGARR